ncbi:hypothetical protein DRJ48_03895 [Candidatus Woesearchaeota archaeon]|nr:hypothetical protein [Candidatus Woesearchaeota archaeon]RLE42248.1 MAG: hypothetical protein DRJ48_03895 [Candidatus Woesearchaeota archaeon]
MRRELPGDREEQIKRLEWKQRHKSREITIIFYGSGAQTESGLTHFLAKDPYQIFGGEVKQIYVVGGDTPESQARVQRIVTASRLNSFPGTKIAPATRGTLEHVVEKLTEEKEIARHGGPEQFHILVFTHAKHLSPEDYKKLGKHPQGKRIHGESNIELIDELAELLNGYTPDHFLCVSNVPEVLLYRAGQVLGMDLRRMSGVSGLDLQRLNLALGKHLQTSLSSKGLSIVNLDWFLVGWHAKSKAWPVLADGELERQDGYVSYLGGFREFGVTFTTEDQLLFYHRISQITDKQFAAWANAKQPSTAPTDTGAAIANTLVAVINDLSIKGNSMFYVTDEETGEGLFLMVPIVYNEGLALLDKYLLARMTEFDREMFDKFSKELRDYIASLPQITSGPNYPLRFDGCLEDLVFDTDVLPTHASGDSRLVEVMSHSPTPSHKPRVNLRDKIAARVYSVTQSDSLSIKQIELPSSKGEIWNLREQLDTLRPEKRVKNHPRYKGMPLKPKKTEIIALDANQEELVMLLRIDVSKYSKGKIDFVYSVGYVDVSKGKVNWVSPILEYEQTPIEVNSFGMADTGEVMVGFNHEGKFYIATIEEGKLETEHIVPIEMDAFFQRGNKYYFIRGSAVFTKKQKLRKLVEFPPGCVPEGILGEELFVARDVNGVYFGVDSSWVRFPSLEGIFGLMESREGVKLATVTPTSRIEFYSYKSPSELFKANIRLLPLTSRHCYEGIKSLVFQDKDVCFVVDQRTQIYALSPSVPNQPHIEIPTLDLDYGKMCFVKKK